MSLDKLFDTFASLYPGPASDHWVRRAWTDALDRGYKAEDIIAGAVRYAAYCKAHQTQEQYIKGASRWLEGNAWENNYPMAKQSTSAMPADQARRYYGDWQPIIEPRRIPGGCKAGLACVICHPPNRGLLAPPN